MSIRSAANSDLVLNNLTVNGILTLDTPLTYQDFEVDNLIVTQDTTLNNLSASGNSVVNDLEVTGALTFTNPPTFTNLTTTELTVSGVSANALTIANELDLVANIIAAGTTVTPQQLGYVSGATSNLQTQISALAPINNPTFTGTTTSASAVVNGYTYFGNDGSHIPSGPGNTYGVLGSNMTNSNGELDFVNLGFSQAIPNASAFDWYIMKTGVETLLMRMYTTGELLVNGLLNATGGITTTALTATGSTTLSTSTVNGDLTVNGDEIISGYLNVGGTLGVTGTTTLAAVNTGAMTVTGALHVTGAITSDTSTTFSNMEVLFWQVTGNGTAVQAMALKHNTANNTDYAVFATIYDGYTGGSSGTYNNAGTSTALGQVIISLRTSSSFTFTLAHDNTGDDVNVYVQFLIVYGVSNSGYPSSYTS